MWSVSSDGSDFSFARSFSYPHPPPMTLAGFPEQCGKGAVRGDIFRLLPTLAGELLASQHKYDVNHGIFFSIDFSLSGQENFLLFLPC